MIAINQLSNLLSSPESGRFYGVTMGVVTNNQDKDGLGRVKVKFPWLSDTDESYWARIVSPMAGKERGIYFLPEVGDEVLVAFEQGVIEFPYILGGLWNGKDKPPESNSDGKNNKRIIKSRSGHTIILDDTEDKEQIVIRDKTQKNEIVINSKSNTISLKSDKNEVVIDSQNNAISLKTEKDLTIEAKGKISISGGDLSFDCQNLKIQVKQNCEIKANAKCDIQATAGIGIKCMAGVKINDGALEVT